MAAIQKNLSSWRKMILSGDIEIALEQLKSEVTSGEWTTEEQNSMANYCLITTNEKAFKLIKSNDKDLFTAQRIFLMTNFCCCIIEKTWKCEAGEFLGSLHAICYYFFHTNNIYEALVIGQYSMEFLDRCQGNNLSKDQKTSRVKDILQLYLHHVNKISIDNLQTILDIWKFILSPQAFETKNHHLTLVFKCFRNFCYKVNSPECHQSSLLIMSYLSKMPIINFTDEDMEIFINICELLIRYSKNDHLKNSIPNIVHCIEEMKSSYNADQHLALQFCCSVLRFSVSLCDSSASSILVDKCLNGLNSISSRIPMPLLIRAVNFTRVVLIQTQNSWIDAEKFFYRDCLPNLFAFLTKLSEILKSIEMDQNDTIKENRYFNVSGLALLIIQRVQNLSSEELIEIYSYVKKCLSISLEVYNDNCKIDNSQKTQLYNNIGAHSFNVCYFYSKAELHNEYEDLCLMTIQKMTAVPNDLVENSTLQSYIKKLVIFLYQSNKYEAALNTTCIWAAKLPSCRTAFMDSYGILKRRIFYKNEERFLQNKTCWDLIRDYQQKNSNLWKKINFTSRDAMCLLKLELKQMFIHQIHLADLVEKIVTQSKKLGDSTEIELCILAGLLFTQSESVDHAMKLIPMVNNCIESLTRKLDQEISKEKIIENTSFLGCLHYVKFRIKLLNARCENKEEVKITSSIKTVPSEPGMEPEVRDDSDVIHKYLTYKSQQEFISYLDCAIDCWSRALTEATDVKDLEQLEKCLKIGEECDIQGLILETALMFRLYCAESKEIRAWKLLHSLASIRKDDEKIIYAFSNLVSMNAEIDPEWETNVQEILPSVEKFTQIRYRLELIHKLFINGRGIEGVEMLSQISEDDLQSNDFLAAKYNFLISQYTLANFFNTSDYPLKTALRAFQLVINCIKKNCWRYFWEACEMQSLFLDVGLFIIQFLLATSQTTLIKTFVDKAVYLIKKLGLPLRICKVLTVLCTLGVATCKCDDIYVKLYALTSVLEFNDNVKEEKYDKKHFLKIPATLTSVDYHSNTDVRFVSDFDDNYTSPILESGLKYDMPEFVYHKLPCECVICNDMHYQQISCEVMSLFGSYFWLQKSNHHGQALRHFQDALEISNKLCIRWKDIDGSKIDGFLKTLIVTKMCLGDFWASNNDFVKAEELNKEALNEFENLAIPNGALRAQLNDQCLALEYIKLSSCIKQDIPKKKAVRQKLQLGSTAKPLVCKTTVMVFEDDEESSRMSELMKSMTITPIPRHSRRLLFKDDDEFCKPTASSRTTRIKNKKVETPPDIVMQTPSSLKFNPRRQLKNELASTHRLINDDDLFTTPAKLTSSTRTIRNKKTEENTDADILTQTPSYRNRSKKILEPSKIPSAAIKIDDGLFTTPAKLTSSSRTTRKFEEKPDAESLMQTPSSRTRSKKIVESKISSGVIKIDDDLLAVSAEPSTSNFTTKRKTKKDNHVPLDIVKEAPSTSRSHSKKGIEKKIASSIQSSSRLRMRKN